jgi:hypothetical protein
MNSDLRAAYRTAPMRRSSMIAVPRERLWWELLGTNADVQQGILVRRDDQVKVSMCCGQI